MRKRLKKDIKKKFGPVYWSKKLRDQRRELLSDALDRYDEELQKGADPLRAYRAAYDSVGNTEALRESFGVDKRRKIRMIVFMSVLSVLLTTPAITLLVLLSEEYALGWICLAPLLSAMALLLYCLWRLLNRDYYTKGWLIFGTVLGGLVTVLICIPFTVFFPLIFWDESHRTERPYDTYLYVRESEEIESVSYVHIEYKSHGLTYTVIDTVDRDHWTDALLDLSITPVYSKTYEATETNGFMICFQDGHEPSSVIYGDRTVFVVHRTGSEVEQYGSYTNSEEWKQMLRKYVNTAKN